MAHLQNKSLKIAINGAGIAGPTLAWWLKKYGFEPVLFEKSPILRQGGYIVDFWGLGYDIADKMGILPELKKSGYLIDALNLVDNKGKTLAQLNTKSLRYALKDRFISIARSNISSVIHSFCDDVETRFNTSIIGLQETQDNISVELSDNTKENFDLVIGADGLHSQIRSLAFGPYAQYEKNLGAYVIAFTVKDYKHRDDLFYVSHAATKKQVARVSLRDNETLFLFTFSSSLIDKIPESLADQKSAIRSIFNDMGWEVADILRHLDYVEDLYFDSVSQIMMQEWSKGRVALVGDACACVSLLAGEGTGLAMVEAYILAGELKNANGDYAKAFDSYAKKLQPLILQKQNMAAKMLPFFVPQTNFQRFLVRMGIKLCSLPGLSTIFLGSMLRDDLELPIYT